MIETLSMFATCVIPNCDNVVADTGDACGECRKVFGWMLAESDRPRMTEEQITARDHAVVDVLTERRMMAPILDLDLPEPPVDARERKQGQTCWLCEERRTCTATADGWECDRCQQVEA